ncbi:DMP19 family protein [Olleya marilimosa]|uniref:DMP19 family protein n=1 Tax=Olleya marilimosa TaxID=272164 RepID=A0ABR8LRV2_9FLAO|nr:DMP19 family protein [Olleya marilimosa]MBD3861849.1 DMP19 family protein [Olleya marilimosa]MBD3889345.1 DMP19 family protein [Olleya marilimosa]
MTEIDFALNQKQDTEIIELVGTVLWNKASEVSSFEQLSEPEKTFVYIDIFEGELNNGGLFDFFYNTSGAFAHQVLDAYQAIGADESAAIVSQAIALFPDLPVSKDLFIRRQLLSNLKQTVLDEWEKLETQFFISEEAIVTLLIDYITIKKTYFEY